MASTWDVELVSRLRFYINDLDNTNYTWTDDQLKNFLALAAIHVSNDIGDYGGVTFEVSLTGTSGPTITPDPIDSVDDFINNLIVVKSACIIANAELKKGSASGGYKIIDDKSTIDTTGRIKDLKITADSYCEAYETAVKEFRMDNSFGRNNARFILAPYSDGRYST